MNDDELMVFLQQKPHLFEITRDVLLMKILKDLYNGGKSATELSDKYNVDHDQLVEKFLKLIELKVLDRNESGQHMLYFLDFDGRKLIDLYKSTKPEN